MPETIVDHRWDNRSEDREVYDLIFDVALAMTRDPELKLVGALLLILVNDWEKNRRSVSIRAINAAYELAKANEALAWGSLANKLAGILEGMEESDA